ncbi:hypothetical protein C1H46_000242 [Malus baccata]|uniref:Uncharacterized protein n=1 Tax=Malus baccata TaxID=106549 RepID=A0A540NUS0_MALBA|nr:hypothetical protein C1H46_000242 [Malus baccata]
MASHRPTTTPNSPAFLPSPHSHRSLSRYLFLGLSFHNPPQASSSFFSFFFFLHLSLEIGTRVLVRYPIPNHPYS